MTNQEAIMGIKEIRRFFAEINPELVFSTLVSSTTIKCCDMAIEALEKQIPKKIRVYHDESDTEEMFEDMCACPVCDRDLHGGGDKYCPRCGQKILWR